MHFKNFVAIEIVGDIIRNKPHYKGIFELIRKSHTPRINILNWHDMLAVYVQFCHQVYSETDVDM